MSKEHICLKCLKWEGRVVKGSPLWRAKCSHISELTEQTDFCVFWIEELSTKVPSGGIKQQVFKPVKIKKEDTILERWKKSMYFNFTK